MMWCLFPGDRQLQCQIACRGCGKTIPRRNEHLFCARRAIDFGATVGVVTRDVLMANRAGEFDFAHGGGGEVFSGAGTIRGRLG